MGNILSDLNETKDLSNVKNIFNTPLQINTNIKSQQCNNCNGPYNNNKCYELCPPPKVNETIQIKNEIPSSRNETHQYLREKSAKVNINKEFQPSPQEIIQLEVNKIVDLKETKNDCSDGYWKDRSSGICYQTCSLDSQERWPDRKCKCNMGEPNQNCDSKFRCVNNKCEYVGYAENFVSNSMEENFIDIDEVSKNYLQLLENIKSVNEGNMKLDTLLLQLGIASNEILDDDYLITNLNNRINKIKITLNENKINLDELQIQQMREAIKYYEELLNLIMKNKKQHVDNSVEEITFNNNVREVLKLNKEITDKDKLIIINNDSFNQKDETVKILGIVLILVIILAGFSILWFLKAVSNKVFGFIVMGLIAIGVIILLVYYFGNKKYNYANEARKEFNKGLLKSINLLTPDDIVKKCPKKCPPKKKPEDKYPKYDISGNEIYPTNAVNYWKHGDVSVLVGEPTEKNEKVLGNYSPQPYYKAPTNPKYHNLVWQGPPEGRIAFDHGQQMSTTIPAEYWPGYKSE